MNERNWHERELRNFLPRSWSDCLAARTTGMLRAVTRTASVQTARFASTNVSAGQAKRPVSPHVTIYKFPLPALTSITTRATGVGLGIGLSLLYSRAHTNSHVSGSIGIATAALFGNCDIPSMVHSFQQSAPILVPVAKAVVAFPLVFHSLAGIRHMYWDKTASHLDLASVELSSQILTGSSIVLTLVLAATTV